MKRFDSKVCIVTGGGSGIGWAISSAFAKEGATVAVFARGETSALQIKQDKDGNHAKNITFFQVNVADRKSVKNGIQDVIGKFGAIDILVNNAGAFSTGVISAITMENWTNVLETNLTGAFNCTQEALPHLKKKKGANIVNVSSTGGIRLSIFNSANYTASKAGLLGFTRHCASDLGGWGIRVNSVCPGATVTDSRPMSERLETALNRRHPLGRMPKADEIAPAILFLASDEARMITGANINIDAGDLVNVGDDYAAIMAIKGEKFSG